MNELNDSNLPDDYREFSTDSRSFTVSHRILDPVLRLQISSGVYQAKLGAIIQKKGERSFLPARSINHNWIMDGERIKPLPVDVKNYTAKLLATCDPNLLKLPDVIRIINEKPESITIEVAKEVFETANSRSKEDNLELPIDGLKADLFPYQKNGVAWMQETLKRTGGLILADEMGLGKTIQIIALFLLHPPSNEHPALIVCPTSLIANWCRELEKFAPSITYLVHRGSNRSGYYKNLMRSGVVITTYDTLANDISAIVGVNWSYLVCDEAQAAKNPESKRRQALGRVPRENTIPVTGTPVETSLMDLWSLGDLAIPGLLGSKEAFPSIYPDSEDGAQNLSQVTDPIILKRQVKDVAADLPERTDIDLAIDMSDGEAAEYERIRQEVLEEYKSAGPLVAVGQLSLFAAHPWLRMRDANNPHWEKEIELKENDAYSLVTPKIEACLNILREAFFRNKKVLIFASYNHCGELIRRAADQSSTPKAYWNAINGSTPQAERQGIVDEFSKHEGPAVLVLNPRAAGAGLNITAATIVIHYTQNWNPALEMQASARAHRRGQDMPVSVYKLFYQNTVEETMVERSAWRASIADHAVPISTRDKQDFSAALGSSPLKS